MGKMVVSDGL